MVALLAFDFLMKLVSKAEMAAVSGVEGLGSLHAWLGQELEVRGIDAVIYTRYILSILQQDSFIPDDLDLAADNHFFPPNRKDAQRGRSTFRNSRKSEKRRPVEIADCEERKKSAAVECLLSLSDEDSGIESLVEEIYSKLKEQQATSAESCENQTQPDAASSSDSDSSDNAAGPAERYYAAFPALSTETEGTVVPSLTSKGGVWAAKVTQGLARNDTGRLSAMTRLASSDTSEEQEGEHGEVSTLGSQGNGDEGKEEHPIKLSPGFARYDNCESHKGLPYGIDHQVERVSPSVKKAGGEMHSKFSKNSKTQVRNSKAWKDYEYMKPIFIIPKAPSPDVNMPRVRSVRTNQKTESVLDFFFKSRVALASPLLDEICYCGAESVWRCTSGCLSWPEMLGLGADSEDQSWYTEPLDMMVRPSPMPSRRLYNRRSVFSSLTNWALYENKFTYHDEENGLEALGLTTLLSRTLDEYGSNKVNEDDKMESNIFQPQDLEDSANEEIDTTSSETVSEVSSEIYQITLDSEVHDPRGISEEKEKVGRESEEEVAYPSHITLNSLEKAKPVEGVSSQSLNMGYEEEEEDAVKGGFSSSNVSLIGTPESQVPWETPELTELLSQERSLNSSPIQTSLVEGLWDIPSGHRSSFSEDGKPEEPVLHQVIESIWNCGQLSPALGDSNEVFLDVDNDKKWVRSSISPASKLEGHPSFQVRRIIGGTLEESAGTIEVAKPGIHTNAPALKGDFGLGSGVWEASPLSPCATQGHLSTPSSSENEVLDDRPYFNMPLSSHDHPINEDINQESPIPIPPIEFNFSDSEDDDDDGGGEGGHHLPHLGHPVHHPSTPHHQRHPSSSPSFYLPHSHSHSCIENIDHLDIWKDHDATTSSSTTEASADEPFRKEGQDGKMVGGEEHRGIMASLTCDTLETGSRWSQCSPLTDMLLTTSLPMFLDNSNVWSYCLEKVFPPKVDKSPIEGDWPDRYSIRDPWSAITLPLSPIHGGSDLSHLWDINAVHRSEWKPDTGTIGMETQNIRRYLMNLRFEIPSQEKRCKIIEGDLYGTLLAPGSWSVKEQNSPSWSMWKCCSPQLQSLASSDVFDSLPKPESANGDRENDAEGAKLWHNFSAKPLFFRQRSTSADNADLVVSDAGSPRYHRCHLLGSTDLLPSENSAFCDKIPPRLPHLPHVQSEPTLDVERLQRGHVYNHGRLVQVRSLYKSDTSILHQLGLATAYEQQPSSEIEVQPHTHFVPINSENGLKESRTTNSDPAKSSNSKDESQYIPTPSGPVPNVCPVLGRDSSYQLYYNEEDDDESGSSPEVFVPRFQVQKDTEKWCQTGEKSADGTPECMAASDIQGSEESAFREDSVGALTSLIPKYIAPCEDVPDALEVTEELDALIQEEPEVQDEVALSTLNDVEGAEAGEICDPLTEEESKDQETLGMFLYDMKDVLELSVEDAERFINGDVAQGDDPDQDKDDIEYSSDYESMGGEQVSVEELGRAGIAELWEEDVEDEEDPALTPVPILVPAPSPSVPIAPGGGAPSAGNYRSIWSWGTDPELPSIPDNFTSTPHTSFIGAESGLSSSFDGSVSGHIPWSCAEVDIPGMHVIGEEDLGGQFAIGGDGDLGPEWLDDNDVFIDDPDVQMQLIGVDPNPEPDKLLFSSDLEEHWLNTESTFTVQVPIKRHVSDRKKPCSFFLEGNCRRTDCKYAHDISNITCRFWEEGDCFKGVTCPFLHGYVEGRRQEKCQRSSVEGDFNFEEEEFPELSSSQDETGSHMRNAASRRRTSSKRFEDRSSRNSTDYSERNPKGDTEKRNKKSGSTGGRLSLKAIGNKLNASSDKKNTKKSPKE